MLVNENSLKIVVGWFKKKHQKILKMSETEAKLWKKFVKNHWKKVKIQKNGKKCIKIVKNH